MPRLTGLPRRSIPGPPPIPLLGRLPRMFRLMDDPIAVVEALRPLGDVVAVCRDDPTFVCAFGSERNHDVLANPDAFLHDEALLEGRPGTSVARVSAMIVCINGERHKRHRRLIAPALSKSALGGYAGRTVEITERMLEQWPRGEVVDLDLLLRELTRCVSIRNLFGVDMRGAAELGELAAGFAQAVTTPLSLLLPRDLPGTPYRRALRVGDRLIAQLERLIADKRRHAEPEHDVLALLLGAVDDDGSGFSDDELLPEVMALFVAGYETTARTLSWTLFLLERHPDVLADVLDELDAVLGGRAMTVADVPRLPLLDRVIKESMRLLPSVPLLFYRVTSSEVALGSVSLPRGANVIVSPYATHRDPDLYPEPRHFRPARWEGRKPSPYEYLPFGAGPRICLGAAFAQQALRLMLPIILQRTRVSLVPGARIDRLVRANILMPRHGLPMRLEAPHRRRLEPAPVRGNVHEMVALR